jgi:hypothetical protein
MECSAPQVFCMRVSVSTLARSVLHRYLLRHIIIIRWIPALKNVGTSQPIQDFGSHTHGPEMVLGPLATRALCVQPLPHRLPEARAALLLGQVERGGACACSSVESGAFLSVERGAFLSVERWGDRCHAHLCCVPLPGLP